MSSYYFVKELKPGVRSSRYQVAAAIGMEVPMMNGKRGKISSLSAAACYEAPFGIIIGNDFSVQYRYRRDGTPLPRFREEGAPDVDFEALMDENTAYKVSSDEYESAVSAAGLDLEDRLAELAWQPLASVPDDALVLAREVGREGSFPNYITKTYYDIGLGSRCKRWRQNILKAGEGDGRQGFVLLPNKVPGVAREDPRESNFHGWISQKAEFPDAVSSEPPRALADEIPLSAERLKELIVYVDCLRPGDLSPISLRILLEWCVRVADNRAPVDPGDHDGVKTLSFKDKNAQDLLWEYARRIDADQTEEAGRIKAALVDAGFQPAVHGLAYEAKPVPWRLQCGPGPYYPFGRR